MAYRDGNIIEIGHCFDNSSSGGGTARIKGSSELPALVIDVDYKEARPLVKRLATLASDIITGWMIGSGIVTAVWLLVFIVEIWRQ